jgi:hypothetical protein
MYLVTDMTVASDALLGEWNAYVWLKEFQSWETRQKPLPMKAC